MKLWHILLLVCLRGILPLTADQITLSGTDLFNDEVKAGIEQAGEPMGLKASWGGSFQALQDLKSGKVDMAILTSPSPEELPDVVGIRRLPLAYRLCRVVVAKDNPINAITYQQLRSIYGSRTQQRLESWKEIAKPSDILPEEWTNRVIEPMLPIAYSSFSREIFSYSVLKNDRVHPSVKVYKNEKDLQTAFAGKVGAIAVIASLSAEQFSKALPVAKEGGESFSATPENLYFGDYPLYMPFSLYFPEIRTKEFLPIVEAFYSETVSKTIFESGLAPVPDAFRKAELNRLKQGF